MASISSHIHIGTSGWSYGHWAGVFYPAGLDQREMFGYYCRYFQTVEINRTFYSLPTKETVARWHDQSPRDFIFSVKASRFMTHLKKLKDPTEPMRLFFACLDGLGGKLGPILFQLPPRWKINSARLDSFLRQLPGTYRYVFEFRDPSWFDQEIYDTLRNHNAAFCLYDLSGWQSPWELTADFIYIRLHGPGKAYQGRYGNQGLNRWAASIRKWHNDGREIFCYFDNDEKGFATRDALDLQNILQG